MSVIRNDEAEKLTMMEVAMDKMAVGVAVLDEAYKFVYCNDALCELFDLITNNLVGKHFEEVFGAVDESADCQDGEICGVLKLVEHAMHITHEYPRNSGYLKKAYTFDGRVVEKDIRYTVDRMQYRDKHYCLLTVDDVTRSK